MKSTFRPNNNDEVIEFLNRRFPLDKDCNWVDGNCYYMAIILNSRFPMGTIYYDVIDGHFLFKLHDKFYDFTGQVDVSNAESGHIVEWKHFANYDLSQRNAVERDCVL